jgi:S1-C subfamily serine protease
MLHGFSPLIRPRGCLKGARVRSSSGRVLGALAFLAGVLVLFLWRLAAATPALMEGAGTASLLGPEKWGQDGQASNLQYGARDDLDQDEQSTIALFKRASPAVVHITNLGLLRQRFSLSATEVPQGTGSGFLWDERGHVVTNFHVIDKGSKFKVTLADRSEWDAEYVGAAPNHDLAVLRIQAPRGRLSALAVGRSAGLAVGQKVFAIGNPFGLDQTLTTGIISGLGREIRSVSNHKISDVIQTDAAINPGNSGGPLLDSAGRLIGINTAIVSPSGAYAGIGFAVPVDTVARVVPQLITKGRVTRPGLGIVPAPNYLAQRLGVRGVIVTDVSTEGAAKQAGLRPAMRYDDGSMELDVIVSLDGKAVERVEDLFDFLDQRSIGDVVEVGVRRGSKILTLPVTLRELQD